MSTNDTVNHALSALAESIGTIVDVDDDQISALNEAFTQFADYVSKHDDGDVKATSHHASQEAPVAINLSDVVKNYGVVSLCKFMVEKQSSFGATEHELVALATEDAAHRYPGSTPAMAFAKLYEESAELRGAIEVCKNAMFEDAMSAELERDARKACEELAAIGKQRWPNLAPASRFARAFETNPELAKRAHRRPGPSTSFPFAKEKQPMRASLEPRVADNQNVDDASEALAQLRQIARDRWPNESEAQAFINVMSNAEYGELIHRALGRPTESSPPRQS
jgi:hypothetical protein